MEQKWEDPPDRGDESLFGIALAPRGEILLAEEAVMRGRVWTKCILGMGALASVLLAQSKPAYGQVSEQPASQKMDLATIGALVQQLQAQVQDLHVQVKELNTQQQSAKAESAQLRKELEAAKSQLMALATPANNGPLGQAA